MSHRWCGMGRQGNLNDVQDFCSEDCGTRLRLLRVVLTVPWLYTDRILHTTKLPGVSPETLTLNPKLLKPKLLNPINPKPSGCSV